MSVAHDSSAIDTFLLIPSSPGVPNLAARDFDKSKPMKTAALAPMQLWLLPSSWWCRFLYGLMMADDTLNAETQ